MAHLPLHLLAFLILSVRGTPAKNGLPPIEDLVIPNGYPFEAYVVETEDGCKLAIHRIPYGRAEKKPPSWTLRPVVYLQHGLLDSSAGFLVNGPSSSLGFILADAGFDVWLGNSRGNTYSSFALQQNAERDAFWDFSLDEFVAYDLPSSLQFALTQTGAESLVYVAHSQGTAVGHAFFATRHPLVRRISLAVMLSPVAFVKHISSPFLQTLARTRVDTFVALWGFHRFLPTTEALHNFCAPFCTRAGPACADLISILVGYDPGNIDPAMWDTYLYYYPAGSSVKLMEYWAQGVRRRNDQLFQKYDYGSNCLFRSPIQSYPCNQRAYKSRQPPEYELGKIQVPLVYFHGGRDALADPIDVGHLMQALSPGVLLEKHLLQEYSHMDFVWGMDARSRVYEPLVQLVKERVKLQTVVA